MTLDCGEYRFDGWATDAALAAALIQAGFQRLEKEQDAALSVGPDGWLLLVALEGRLDLIAPGRRIDLDGRFAVLLPAGVQCTVTPGKGVAECACAYAELSGGAVRSQIAELADAAFSPFFLREDAPLADLLLAVVSDAQRHRIADPYAASLRAYALLMELCRRFLPGGQEPYPELVAGALAMIREEYQYLFGVEELAEALEVSKHHLIRQFTRHVGISPGRFLARTRIDNARQLLCEKEYTIEVVGQLVGYANGNYFAKAFRSQTGMSPGEYRARFC